MENPPHHQQMENPSVQMVHKPHCSACLPNWICHRRCLVFILYDALSHYIINMWTSMILGRYMFLSTTVLSPNCHPVAWRVSITKLIILIIQPNLNSALFSMYVSQQHQTSACMFRSDNEDEESTSALRSTGMTDTVLFKFYHPKNAQFSQNARSTHLLPWKHMHICISLLFNRLHANTQQI